MSVWVLYMGLSVLMHVCIPQSKPLNVEYLMMDASILLPPTGTPLTGIDFVKRLPCGDVEKTRRVRPHTNTPALILTQVYLVLHSFGFVLCQQQQPCYKHMTPEWQHSKVHMKDKMG